MRPASVILFALLLFPPLASSGCHLFEAADWATHPQPEAQGKTPVNEFVNGLLARDWVAVGGVVAAFVATAIMGVKPGQKKAIKKLIADAAAIAKETK